MGTVNYDFTYIDGSSPLTIVEDTTTFLDEIDAVIYDNEVDAEQKIEEAITKGNLDIKNMQPAGYNVNDAAVPGVYAFNVEDAAKCWYEDTTDSYVWYDWSGYRPQSRQLILPFHKDIIENKSQVGIVVVYKQADFICQMLYLTESGIFFVRKYDGSEWGAWTPYNFNVTGIGADDKTIDSIVSVANSYIVAPTTYYHYGANWYTCTSPVTGTELKTNVGTDAQGLDCSGFLEMVSLGVQYPYSRFNPDYNDNRVNINGLGGYCFDIYGGNEDIRATNNMALTNTKAEWCRDNGIGYYPNDNLSNLKPGDWFFNGHIDSHPDRWLGIDHCGIFLGYNDADGSIFTLEVSGSSGTEKAARCYYRTKAWFKDNCVYCARPSYGTTVGDRYRSKTVSYSLPCHNDGSTSVMVCPTPIPENTPVFVNFDGYLTSVGDYFTVYFYDGEGNSTAIVTTKRMASARTTNRNVKYRVMYPAAHSDITGNIAKVLIRPNSGASGHIHNAYVTTGYDGENMCNVYYFTADDWTNVYVKNIVQFGDYKSGTAIMATTNAPAIFGNIKQYTYDIMLDTNGTGYIVFTGYGSGLMRIVRVPITTYNADVASATSHEINY